MKNWGLVFLVTEFKNGELTVAAVPENSAAFRSGLRTDDIITEIDSQPTKGLSETDARLRLAGEAGTAVRLKIFRPSTHETKEYTLIREDPSVTPKSTVSSAAQAAQAAQAAREKASSGVLPVNPVESAGETEIAAAKAAAVREPQNWRVFNDLGLVYYRQTLYDQAVAAFQQALAMYSITSVLETEKKQADAVATQRAAIAAKRETDIQRANALQSQQSMNELFGMFSNLAGMNGDTQGQMLLSTMQTINNQIDSVPNSVPPLSPELKMESSLKSKREVANIYICLGSAYFGKEDYQQAVASFENAMQLDPSRTEVLKTSAEAQYFLCRYDECIRTFAKYHAIAPVETASLLRLSDAYRAVGMQPQANKAFAAFLALEERSPADCVKLLRIGSLCLTRWRYDEALKFLTEARQSAAASPENARIFAEAVRKQFEIEVLKFVTEARHSATSSPENARIFAAAQLKQFEMPGAIQLLLAEAQFNLRHTTDAIALLTDAVTQDQANSPAWYLLAQCHDEAGDSANALQSYRKALTTGQAKHASAHYIQVCRAAIGEGDAAVKTLETQLESVPLTPGDGADQWCELAFALEKAGRVPEAMEIFSRCIEVSPSYSRARLALERLGRQADAERRQAQAESDAAMKSGDRMQAIMKLAVAYRLTPAGQGKEALRKTLLKTAAGMDNPPAMTGDAQDHYLRGSVALKAAKNPVDLGRSLSEFQWAVFYSPWVGDLYFNTSAVKKLQNQTAAAVSDLKWYLAAMPAASNVSEMLNRLYEFDYQHEQKMRELAAVAAF